MDPISKKFPELTPYQFASNRPIDGIDLDGLEWAGTTNKHNMANVGNPSQSNVDWQGVILMAAQSYWGGMRQSVADMAEGFSAENVHGSWSNFKGLVSDFGMMTIGDKDAIKSFSQRTFNGSMTVANTLVEPVNFIATMNKRSLNENMYGLGYYSTQALATYLLDRFTADLGRVDGGSIKKPTPVNETFFDPFLFRGAEVSSNKKWFVYAGEEVGYYFYTKEAGLEMSINIPSKYQDLGIGSIIFKQGVENTKAVKFTATWVRSSIYETGSSVNLTRYNSAIKRGLSRENAAFETWSGKQAKAHGFTNVVVKEIENGIQATFTK